jgi:hypothetical protein
MGYTPNTLAPVCTGRIVHSISKQRKESRTVNTTAANYLVTVISNGNVKHTEYTATAKCAAHVILDRRGAVDSEEQDAAMHAAWVVDNTDMPGVCVLDDTTYIITRISNLVDRMKADDSPIVTITRVR